MGENIRVKSVKENKNYWTSNQEKWEKKAQVKRGKKTKKGVTWADESKTSAGTAGNDEGHLGRSGCGGKSEESCSVKASNTDQEQAEEKNGESQRDESFLTLKESKTKADNTAADNERDSVQSNELGDSIQRSKRDSGGSETLPTNDITKKNDGQGEITDEKHECPEKSDEDASSGASRVERLTDTTGDDEPEKSNTATKIKTEKTSVKEPTGASPAKPGKSVKNVKSKRKKK